jgi:hypothetical protein
MEEPATSIGGQLVVAPSPGSGMTVTAHLPIDAIGSA